MKQLTTAILSGAVILLVLSCNSTADPLSKKYPNMIANVEPFSIGTVEVQFDRFFSTKVDKVEAEVVFHPRLNAVSLDFKFELIKYRQYWDEAARKQFAASLELYKRDFEDRKLVNNYSKTTSIYGKTKLRLEWEAFKYTKTRIASPAVEIGYKFKENTPFLTTLMRSAKEELTPEDSSKPMDSQQISMYLTRAQGDEVIKLFDQSRLIELLGMQTGAINNNPPEAEAERDAYKEYGE
jgi:hypothetical protein